MPLLFRLTFLFLFFHPSAHAAFTTYKGPELNSGGECVVAIISQKDSYLEVLVTVTIKRELVYLDTLTLQTVLKPAFRTRDYDRTERIDAAYTLEFTKLYYKNTNVRFLNSEKTALAFRQWHTVQTRIPGKPDTLERTVTYNCLNLVRSP